jgi:hypothetical protein
MTKRRLVAVALATAVALGSASLALGAWSASGGGSGDGRALTMPGGNAPTAVATGTTVTVRWAAATFPGGAGVEGYTVQRYSAANGGPATVGAACSGLVTTTTCTETGVTAGAWFYTVVPVQGGWHGAESPAGNTVTTG